MKPCWPQNQYSCGSSLLAQVLMIPLNTCTDLCISATHVYTFRRPCLGAEVVGLDSFTIMCETFAASGWKWNPSFKIDSARDWYDLNSDRCQRNVIVSGISILLSQVRSHSLEVRLIFELRIVVNLIDSHLIDFLRQFSTFPSLVWWFWVCLRSSEIFDALSLGQN